MRRGREFRALFFSPHDVRTQPEGSLVQAMKGALIGNWFCLAL
jgi:hypothetical protein